MFTNSKNNMSIEEIEIFMKEKKANVEEKLSKIIPLAIRFMDNVNDITNVPLEGQKENLKNKDGIDYIEVGGRILYPKLKIAEFQAKRKIKSA